MVQKNRALLELQIITNNSADAKVEHELYDYAGNNWIQRYRNKRF